MPTLTLPDAARSPHFSGYDDNSERTSTLPFGAARLSSPLLPEQLVSRTHNYFPKDGGPDTARLPQPLPAYHDSEDTGMSDPELIHLISPCGIKLTFVMR